MLPLSVKAGILSAVFMAVNSFDKLLLPKFTDPKDYGAYIALYQLATGGFILLHAIWAPINTEIQSALQKNNINDMRRIFIRGALIISISGGFGVVVLSMIGDQIASLWLGGYHRNFGVILLIIGAGFYYAAMLHFSLSFRYAFGQIFGIVKASLVVILFIVGITYLLENIILDGNIILYASLAWAFFYLMLFMIIGFITHNKEKPILMQKEWVYYCTAPLLLSTLISSIICIVTYNEQLSI